MDFSKYGVPCQEWIDFDAAHPELHINDEGKDDDTRYESPKQMRDLINEQRLLGTRLGLVKSGLDKKVTITTHSVPARDGATLPLREYRQTGLDPRARVPVFLFFHGGGMLFGTPEGEDLGCSRMANDMALKSGFAVLSLCYRHTPDYTFPTQIHDAWDAFEWIMDHHGELAIDAANVLVGGISAGASLTAALVYREVAQAKLENRPIRVKGQFLANPWLIHPEVYPYDLFASRDVCSMVQAVDAPILPKARYDVFTSIYQVTPPGVDIANVALASDESLKGMPKTVLIVSGRDMLRDEAFIFASKLDRLGIPVKKHLFPGMPHAFRRHPDLDSSHRWDAVTDDCVRWIFDDSAKPDEQGKWSIEVPEKYREVDSHYFD